MHGKWLDLAIEHALNNPIVGLPRMAAILITPEGDTFVGRNQLKSHPLQATFARNPMSIFLHAEIDMLIQFMHNKGFRIGEAKTAKECWYYEKLIKRSSVYVARVLKNGQPALAKPCSGCLGALLHFGVEHIKWTV